MTALNFILIFVPALFLSSPGSAEITARYIGPDQGNWGDPANWDVNQVPANDPSQQFRVEIEGVTAITFNLQSPARINHLSLDNVHLNLPGGTDLLITQGAEINGRIDVGSSAAFESTNLATSLLSNAQLWVSAGGYGKLAAPSFAYTGQTSRVMMRPDGIDSRLELPDLDRISATGSGGIATRNYEIRATNGGYIDLSNVTSVEGAGGNNWLRFQVGSLSEIDLTSLRRINGHTRWMIQAPGISLPALERLNDQAGLGWLQASQGASIELPALTLAHNAGSFKYRQHGFQPGR